MGYTSFADIDDVCIRFNIGFKEESFIKEKEYKPNKYFLDKLLKNFSNKGTFISEASICERILAPIIEEVADFNNLSFWSHAQFDVDKALDLNGIPDFIFGLPSVTGMKPSKGLVCFAEAKKDKFDEAWGQAGAEMYAAQMKNENKEIPIYAIVSNGKLWEFAKLQGDKFFINKNDYTLPKDINDILNILNWLFCEASKNSKKL